MIGTRRWATVAAWATFLAASPALAVPAKCGRDCKLNSSGVASTIVPPDLALTGFGQYGQYFTYSGANLYPVAGGGVVAYSSPFSFNLGGTTTSTLFAKEDGVASFGRSLAAGGFAATTDLARLGVPLIAPFYADLDSQSRTAIAAGYPGIVIQQGIADPFADAAGAYSLADAKTALQITWYGFDVGGSAAAPGAPVYTQLLLVDEGGGDFDFRIRAGAPGSGAANSPAGGLGGFVFGDDNYQYATPYDSTSAGVFAVRGGAIVDANALAAGVPEPATWLELIVGVCSTGSAMRRLGSRRRCSARAAR